MQHRLSVESCSYESQVVVQLMCESFAMSSAGAMST